MGVVVVLVVLVVIVVLVVFFRAVFGGSTFRRDRGEKRKGDGGDRRGPRPDAHAGASTWTGGGSTGRWGTGSSGG